MIVIGRYFDAFGKACCFLVFGFCSCATASKEIDLQGDLVSMLPDIENMEIAYRLRELKPVARGWLDEITEEAAIAQYGEPFNHTDMIVPGRPFYQLQFALQSADGSYAIVLVKGAISSFVGLKEQYGYVWQKMIVASAKIPKKACVYDVHLDLKTIDKIEYNLRPELIGLTSSDVPQCGVVMRD